MRIDDNWPEDTRKLLPEGNYLITSLDRRYTYEALREFDFIASCTTGIDHLELRDKPLICLRDDPDFLRGIYATAEHTWALILALVRRIPWAFEDVKQDHWNREAWQGTELRGKTLGIVGYGRVGQQVAEIAKAFGMKVIASDLPSGRHDAPYRDHKVEFCILETLLKNADIVTVHVPLNDETRGMFGIEQFKQMKKSAYFINTSRGAVVDEFELCAALTLGYLAGAAVDVVADEQGWNQHSFLGRYAREHNNLIISPHISGNTAESRRKTQIFMATKIKEFIKRRCSI